MVIAKENDFVEVSYVGRIKETNQIFDLTDAELAKKEGVYNPQASYGPKVICLGEQHILKEIDKQLIGKETNKTYTIELTPDKAFGIKDPGLVKIVPTIELQRQKINPFPGLQINASGLLGTIRAVSGGRTTVDFNHPLASKKIIYEIKIEEIVTDNGKKLKGLLGNVLGLNDKEYEAKVEGNKAEVKLKVTISDKAKEEFEAKVKKLISSFEISFS